LADMVAMVDAVLMAATAIRANMEDITVSKALVIMAAHFQAKVREPTVKRNAAMVHGDSKERRSSRFPRKSWLELQAKPSSPTLCS
jgi:hypothetical protein